MSWLKSILRRSTGKIWRTRAESWDEESWIDGLWRIKLKRLLNCSGWVKRILVSKTIMRGWQQVRTTHLQENGVRLKRNSSSIFKCWEWQWEHHHELSRHSRMTIRKIERTMKRIWKILEKDIWLMTNHSYVRLRKEFEKLRENKTSQVRSWKRPVG